jgi:hypothetical protein
MRLGWEDLRGSCGLKRRTRNRSGAVVDGCTGRWFRCYPRKIGVAGPVSPDSDDEVVFVLFFLRLGPFFGLIRPGVDRPWPTCNLSFIFVMLMEAGN